MAGRSRVWSRNLLNKDYFELLSAPPGNTGLYVGQPGDPRTVGVTLRMTFRSKVDGDGYTAPGLALGLTSSLCMATNMSELLSPSSPSRWSPPSSTAALGYGFSSITVPLALLFLSNRVLNPALVLIEVALNAYVLWVNRDALGVVWRRVLPIVVGPGARA